MGGQQSIPCMLADGLGSRAEYGSVLLHIRGADWPKIIEASHAMQAETGKAWGIRQKQTGVVR